MTYSTQTDLQKIRVLTHRSGFTEAAKNLKLMDVANMPRTLAHWERVEAERVANQQKGN